MTKTMNPSDGDSLQTPLLLTSDDASCEEQTLSRVLVEEDQPVSTTEHSMAITMDTTDNCNEAPNGASGNDSALLASNLRLASSCCKDVAAFAVSGVATTVAISLLCLTFEIGCIWNFCGDDDNAVFWVFLCCLDFLSVWMVFRIWKAYYKEGDYEKVLIFCILVFLSVWMVFRIWKAYYKEGDYEKALIFGILVCLTFFGLTLLVPVGYIIGLVLAGIVGCIISKHWPPIEDDSAN